MPTWFLPPDFTFTSDGPIKLGTVIEHPSRPTRVLASLPGDHGITLPKESTIVESNHSHEKSASRSGFFNIWAKFLEVASISAETQVDLATVESYGTVDHDILLFTDPFTPSMVTAITALPDVKKFMDSGLFGKRPVYIVAGLRIAKTSFTVKKEIASSSSGDISGSGPATGGPIPVEVGAGLGGSRERKVTDSYDTAPGIVFAYRLYIIRTKRAGVEAELFSHKTAFMTESGTFAEQPFIITEATKEELEEDIEEEVSSETLDIGDESCIWF